MNTSIGEEVKKIYAKELSDKASTISKSGSKLVIGIIISSSVLAALALSLILIFYFNKFVALQQDAFAQGARVESEYQRRTDHIAKLAGIAIEYARHEQALFKYVSDTRELKMVMETSGNSQISKNLPKLMALAEQYPNLKATQSYQDLMKKIETTEDRISASRGKYSALINKYNKTVCTFPDNLVARIMGFNTLQPYHPKKEPMPLRDKRIFWQ
jgi:LemA protein